MCSRRRTIVQLVLSLIPTSLAFQSFATNKPTSSIFRSGYKAMNAASSASEEKHSSEHYENVADFPGGISSSFKGAGRPRVELNPEDIPSLLMEALKINDIPELDSGLQSMWAFAGGNTKYIFEYNSTSFIESAHETAHEFPTSFYGVAMYGKSWEMETELNRVGGPEGWIATQVMKTISSDGRMRRWQWELRKNRRPPDLGVWLVETIGSSNEKGHFEAED